MSRVPTVLEVDLYLPRNQRSEHRERTPEERSARIDLISAETREISSRFAQAQGQEAAPKVRRYFPMQARDLVDARADLQAIADRLEVPVEVFSVEAGAKEIRGRRDFVRVVVDADALSREVGDSAEAYLGARLDVDRGESIVGRSAGESVRG
jgi:hypothetical protein